MAKWFLSLVLSFSTGIYSWAETPTFSFHMLVEPTNLDPQMTGSASGNYLLYNMYRGLMRFTSDGKLTGDGAKSCVRKKREVICLLDSARKFSNGTAITAADYVASFRRLIDPKLGSLQSDVLFTVKNAKLIWKGEKTSDQLAVFADHPGKLRIELDTDDFEFEYKLIHPALSPLPPGGYLDRKRASEQVTSGPYSIEEWKTNSWLNLKSNVHYSSLKRPPVHVLFVDEDATALRLYENGKMTFLRRVTAGEIPRLRGSPEFKQIAMARFDYIGFGPQLIDKPKIREALVKSIDFDLFLKLFDTRSPPGCPSLPASLMDKVVCQKMALGPAKMIWDAEQDKPKIEFHFSMMGGDDVARAAEWFQGQWKKNLGANVDVKTQEQGVYVRNLKTQPPPVFRKGVNLDRPTCLSGLELFTKGHPDNYIKLEDDKYERLVATVAKAKTEAARKVACRKAVEHLIATFRLIPLGEMHFSVMAKPQFTGWSLNSLNQLDLSTLAVSSPRP